MVLTVIDMDDPLHSGERPRDTPPKPMGEDPPAPAAEPKRRGRKPGDAQLKADLKEIEEKLTQLLTLPSIPMDAAGDHWPARHIETRAPALAHAVTETARNNTQLREKLLQLLRVGDGAGLAIAAGAYLLPVAIYYGIIPIPDPLRTQIPVPTREQARGASIIDQMHAEEERLASMRARTPKDPEEPIVRDPETAVRAAQTRTPPVI